MLPLAGAWTGPALTSEPLTTLSLDPYATRLVLVQLGALAVYFAAAHAFLDGSRRLLNVARTIIVFGFLLALAGLILYFVSPDKVLGIRESSQSLGFGPFINRHHFANYMLMTAGLPLGLLFAGSVAPERRALYAFAAVLMGVALVLTNSRGGMLSLGAEVFFLVVVSGLGRGRCGGGGAGRALRAGCFCARRRAGGSSSRYSSSRCSSAAKSP
jgi:hypothetical protein